LYPKDGAFVDVLVGGQYGSEGKGNIAAYLAKEYALLIRVGGPNAGHTVCFDGGHYIHHQLPSGTLTSNAKLVIGPGAVLNVQALMKEISDCRVESTRLSIDPSAMIITKKHLDSEKDLVASIGSTGQGVGSATADRIMGRSNDRLKLARHVPELAPYVRPTADILDDCFLRGERVLLEGTQGTGLSIYHGSYQHVTSRDTTVSGCLAEAGISPRRVRRVLMVCRTYPIRVQSPPNGTSGMMSQEISLADVASRSGLSLTQLKKTETTSTTGRRRRIAEFDWALLRRASSLNGPTDVALTFTDYISDSNQSARRFEQLTPDTINLIEEIEKVSAAPVSLITTRFHPRGIIDRRKW
jgi:adenylosuccinate synthase